MITFENYGKTPRLSKAGSISITEKIDGSNGAVVIRPVDTVEAWGTDAESVGGVDWVHAQDRTDIQYLIGAQSRNRLVFPGKGKDNTGFAGWVKSNASVLVDLLGAGLHFGEWWGQGIQRGYGLNDKVFSLFNVHRFRSAVSAREGFEEKAINIGLDCVPTLYTGVLSDVAIATALNDLRTYGSMAALNWGSRDQKAEGVIVYHHELRGRLKAFVENDDVPKSLQEGS